MPARSKVAKTSPSAAPPFPAYAVEEWGVERLKPYARNARLHGAEQIQQLRGSFRKFGQVWPILVRKDGTIIAGHGRLEAAKAEGFKAVSVIVASGWTDEQCRAFGLLDNRVPLNAEWDTELLGAELTELQGLGADLDALGFDPDELAELTGTGGAQGLTDPDEAPRPPVNPVARVGDLWALGRHRLLCGDATKAEDTAKVLRGVSPHLMVTDPPYGVSYDATWRGKAGHATMGKNRTGKVASDTTIDWREAWALFPGDVAYIWHADRHASAVQLSLEAADFEIRCQIVWAKTVMAMGRGDYHWKHEPCWYAVRKGATSKWQGDRTQTTLWEMASPLHIMSGSKEEKTPHPTQKPAESMKRPIENNSSPGQAVYDPFVGSGTTIIAAQMTGRSCHAIELDPAYIDVCIKRWQDFTGEKATLDGDGRSFDEIAAERIPAAA